MKFIPASLELLQGHAQGLSRIVAGRRQSLQTMLAGLALAVIWLVAGPTARAADPVDLHAVATWSSPIVSAAPSTANQINNQTLRQIARVSIAGDAVRVKFTNRYGTGSLNVGGAQIALRGANANIVAGSSKTLTFSGSTSFSIPPGAELLSDWVQFAVPALADVAVDLYLPGNTGTSSTGSPLSLFGGAMQTNYLSQTGNFLGATAFPVASTRLTWSFMSAIDTWAANPTGTIVAFGDSITQGLMSTNDTNRRWPDVLARRLVAAGGGNERGVANVGISGNRAWIGGTSTNPSAMARFDRDVLVQTGATHIIMLLGINDISGGATADQVITALKQITVRAHSRGLKIFGGTLTPFDGATDAREAIRVAVNAWIRTTPDFDGVVDFDLAIRDPANPRRMLPIYDSGDTLHPNDAGYEAMGNAINLGMLNIVRSIPRASLPPIDLQVLPSVLNLRTTAGTVAALITVPEGHDLRDWGVFDVRAEGAPALSSALSADGKVLVAVFNKRDLTSLATGDAVLFTVTATANRAGAQGALAGSTTVRVMR